MQKILVVDDNEDMVETLERLFSFYQYKVLKALNGKVAVEVAEKDQPDIIILDAHMPVMDGFEACRILKDKKKTMDIPVVILTAKYIDQQSREDGLKIGADDYLVKPFNSKELVSRIKTLLQKTQMMRALKRENVELSNVQKEVAKEMESNPTRDATGQENLAIDQLTGLYSPKYLWTRLREEYHRALRYETSISLILVDIDSFGRINDNFGYQVGDYVLMKIANTILNNTRVTDIVARLNGAYFAVILPQTDAQGGFFEAERLRVALDKTDYTDDFMTVKRRRKNDLATVTASIGVATYPSEQKITTEKELFNQTKKALDKAKTSGKNKTITFERL
jgi:two-component system, cell cycle response regulator